jgi:hypothetical protein
MTGHSVAIALQYLEVGEQAGSEDAGEQPSARTTMAPAASKF